MHSLRGRLVVGLAFTWLAIVALVLAMTWYLGKSMVNDTSLSYLRYETAMLADELSHEIRSRTRTLSHVADITQAVHDPEALQRRLRHNDALLEWFERLVITDAQGDIAASWPKIDRKSMASVENREFFRMIQGTGYPHVSEPFVGRASRVPMVLIGVPRRDANGDFAGMIGGAMSLQSGGLFARLASKQAGDGSYVTIFTASGKVLYHPDRDELMTDIRSLTHNANLESALIGWEGTAVGELLDGQKGLQSYKQVWPANWIVGQFTTQEQAQAPLAEFIKRLWWIWALMVLWMLPLLWWVLGSMLQTLRHLEIQIGEVGRERRAQIDLTSDVDEFQSIASTFNHVEAQRKTLLNSLQEREAFLNAMLDATPQGMFVANFDGEITYMNPTLLDILGVSTTITTTCWLGYVHPDDHDGTADMWRHSLASHSEFVRQLRFIRPDGNTLWLEVHARVVMLSRGGQSLGLVGTMKDITQRREQEALARWEAEHDPLTGLLNRRGFERRLDEAFAEYKKTSTPSALLLFDLDHFKPINDEGGHALGDEMLRRIAQIVAWEVRRSDHVARQGGDEFAVLLPSCTLPQARNIADSLRIAVSNIAVTHQGKEYCVTLSIGVTSFIDSDQDVAAALSRADAASYEAKLNGRNALVVNVPDDDDVPALFD
ncbi:hypothetical protein GCM10022228_04650 [Halomonas cibimaris]|uniref:Diguanylate cyclase n=1 Tax=Halomonas cibimaris TaxID=657012 RepID=A0ABP7LAZ7_9GAMM